MKKEAAEGIEIPIKSVFKQVTGTSNCTLLHTPKEGEKLQGGQIRSLKKTKPQVSPKTGIDN